MFDSDLERAFRWFVGLFPEAEWRQRRDALKESVRISQIPKARRDEVPLPLPTATDRIVWYLCLVESFLYSEHNYEPTQGSRVIPIFQTIGAHFDQFSSIKGAEIRALRLLRGDKNQPDSGLYELLVALLWVRNGWPDVELLPEAPPTKTPDIRAAAYQKEYFIECKRLTKSSEYSLKEREKWLAMWKHLAMCLEGERLWYVLDITFHVELSELPETFLRDELCGKLRFLSLPCVAVSNGVWDVKVESVDVSAMRKRLAECSIRNHSAQIPLLISGRRDPNRGFTSVMKARIGSMGEGPLNQYIDDVAFAAGTFWSCDAPRAMERKARDIRGHLADAVRQLPENANCVVHVGLETLDGALVEAERYRRIVDTVFSFDTGPKTIACIYCHLFQPYAPPDQAWVIDETVYSFPHRTTYGKEPLGDKFIFGATGDEGVGVHWSKAPP